MSKKIIYYNVSSSGSSPDFISTWDTTQAGSASDTIVLPMTAGPTVDWGDGTVNTLKTHTYAVGGIYTVTISGTVNTFRFAAGGDRRKILDISSWGGFVVYTDQTFHGCENLDISATDAPSITTTSCFRMFRNCYALTTCDFTSWDMSGVQSLSYMFTNCTNFNGDISTWDVSNVNNTFAMFYGSGSISPLFNGDISNWNVSNVTTMGYMLGTQINSRPFDQDLSSWDINQVTVFTDFMANVTLSITNYDALLVAWDAQGVMSYSGTVNFGGSKYTSGGAAETARTSLIAKWGGIVDGGAA